MMIRRWFLLLGCSLAALTACDNSLSFSEIPEIRFVAQSPDTVREYSPVDITIHFQDGDGDLGAANANDTTFNFFAIDSRITEPINGYDGVIKATMPNLTPESRRPSIQGEIKIRLESMLRIDPESPGEVVRFRVYIVDRAGHKSNEVETDSILVIP